MKNKPDSAQTTCVEEQEEKQPPRPEIRPSDVPGFVALIVVVWLIGISIVAHNFVNEHSASIRFGVEATFSFFALIVIVAQAVIYAKQAQTLDAQWELTRESMENSQSAYVTVKDVITNIETMGAPLEFVVRFVNSGTTPAYNCRVYMHINNRPRPFRFTHEEAKDLKGMRVSKAILGANGEIFHQRLNTAPVALSNDLLETEKATPIHFWGIVTYTDVFKRERWTTFCYIRVPFIPQAEADTEGNEADGH